jgi:methylglutaconyl-CoA hydratase
VAGLDIRRAEHTLEVRIPRSAGNLFTMAMIEELASAVELAGRDGATRFVRIASSGEHFCLGRERAGAAPHELRAEAARIVRLNETLRTSPLVSVAEVCGDAAGFGAGLVAACDVAVAADGATFSFPEVRAGLAPTVVIAWLARSVPHKVAFDLVVTGDAIDAHTAARWGLVTEVVPRERVEQSTSDRLERLSSMKASAVREIKEFFTFTRTLDAAAAARASVEALTSSALRMRAETGAGSGVDHRL